jgi:N6-L-threonylcarbamoyladenine synthase
MICLGIETSCDETALALVGGGRVLGEKMASQEGLHALFGGVVPELASREHLRKASSLFAALCAETGLAPSGIDCVAAARGPGLLGSLLVGVNFAKGLALGLGARLIGVNHLHAHLLAAAIEREIAYPALGLLISGGHTHLYLIKSPIDFELLGRTLDDAAGEALDKAAKLVNLPYPGGKFIDHLGKGATPDESLFPRTLAAHAGLDFSFSGLKSAAARHVAAHPELRLPRLPDEGVLATPELAVYCASINHAVARALRAKTRRALNAHPEARSLVVAGGVAANSMIRDVLTQLCIKMGVDAIIPQMSLCTDNAVMIAFLGERLAQSGLYHDMSLEAVPRGRPVPFDHASDAT